MVTGYMSSAPLAIYFGSGLARLGRKVASYTEDSVPAKRAVFELTSNDLLVAFAFPRYPIALLNLTRDSPARIYRWHGVAARSFCRPVRVSDVRTVGGGGFPGAPQLSAGLDCGKL